MFIIAIALPFIACLILMVFFPNLLVWWEYLVIVGVTVGITVLLRLILGSCGVTDIEYLGGYVKSVSYYEPWNEKVYVTKERRVYEGTDAEGNSKYRYETYVDTEIRYHKPKWTMEKSFSWRDEEITEEMYDKIVERFKVKPHYIDLGRKYHTIDGDMYKCEWDHRAETLYSFTDWHKYKNKTLTNGTIFGFDMVTEDEAKELGLYDYPEIVDGHQEQVLGYFAPKRDVEAVEYLNAVCGAPYQFRMYVLYFFKDDASIVEKQKEYWKGGNKNEMVVCIGIDGKGKHKWCEVFSWSDEPKLEIAVRNSILSQEELNLADVCGWIEDNIKLWQRKEFSDFDYIRPQLTVTQAIILLAVSLLVTIGTSVYCCLNGIDVQTGRSDKTEIKF